MTNNERLLPRNHEAEQWFLGTLSRDKVALAESVGLVEAWEFFTIRHQKIYAALEKLRSDGIPVDVVTLAQELSRMGALEDAGGYEYLVELWAMSPCAGHYRQYALIIRDDAAKRKLIELCHDIADRAYNPREPVAEIFADFESRILETIEGGTVSDTKHTSETVKETWATLDERQARRDSFSGIPSGFTELDALTAGFQNGELIILAARPSVGKTAIAVNMSGYVAVCEKVPTVFITLEQSRVELTERLLCCQGLVDSHRLKRGRLRPDEVARAMAAGESLSRSDLYIDDTNGQTIAQISANVRRMKQVRGVRLAIIDYLQLIVPDAKRENRQEQVAAMSRRLKLLARELKIPIIVLAQLNREAEKRGDGRPKLSDLRESGAIEQDADVVILLHRLVDDRGQNDGIVEAIVAKHRNGPTGTASLLYIKQHMRFENFTTGNGTGA